MSCLLEFYEKDIKCHWFSDVFKGFYKRSVALNGLIMGLNIAFSINSCYHSIDRECSDTERPANRIN